MGFRPKYTLLSIIQGLGLTGNLKLCLDAGDASSYSSGQKWLDTSGGGYDFFLGASGSSGADDPTFNGTPGDLSTAEFWSFDGGDFFRYDTANEAWMQNIHKNNAKFTIVAWVYPASFAASVGIAGTSSSSTANGFSFRLNTSGQLQLVVGNNDGTPANALVQVSAIAATAAAWNFVGVSLDEAVGAGGINWVVNGSTDTDSSTYTSPATGGAINTMEVGAIGAGLLPFINGSRIAMLAMWEGVALTAAQINDIYKGTIAVAASAAGVGTATGVGSARASSTASSSGLGVAMGVGSNTASAVAATVGAGIATGVGTPVIYGVGNASGLGVASGVLRATSASVALATGVGVATGVLRSTAAASGASAGVGVASGVLRATSASVAFSTGVGVATGIGFSFGTGTGAAAGAATVLGVGTTVYNSVGDAYGQGQAYGISYAFFFDPEVVCVRNEPRVAYVEGIEVEYLNVPWERRDNDSTSRGQSTDTLNRQRKF